MNFCWANAAASWIPTSTNNIPNPDPIYQKRTMFLKIFPIFENSLAFGSKQGLINSNSTLARLLS